MIKIKQKLLVIGHVWPQPNATAAGEHLLHLIRFFKDMDFKILFTSAAKAPKVYNDLKNISIPTLQTQINNDDFNTILLDFKPDVVLFDRFMVEEQFSWRVKQICPKAIRILDTEDIHFLRKKRESEFKKNKEESFSEIAKRELASMYRCDLNLVISLNEIKILTEQYNFPKILLHYTPLLSEKVKALSFNNFEERKDLIFVGNFLHNPNWQVVQTLKKDIWPILSKKLPDAKLNIYGAYAQPKHLQLNNESQRFYVHGYIEDIVSELKRSKLLIAPIIFGSGQKGKLLKAMQCGTPCVTTTVGVEGMDLSDDWAGSVVDDYKSFIEQTVQLYTNVVQWNQTQQHIPSLVNNNFNYRIHYSFFKKRFNDLKENVNKHRESNIFGQIIWHQSLRSTEFMSRWIMEKNK